MMSTVRQKLNRETLYPRYWYLIALRWIGALIIALGIAPALVLPQENLTTVGEIVAIAMFGLLTIGGILFVVSLAAPIALSIERKRLKGTDKWYPSRWYYLMLFPTGLIGFILTIVYTRRRLRHYGYESVSFEDKSSSSEKEEEETVNISHDALAEKIKETEPGYVITKREFKKLAPTENAEQWWDDTAKPALASSETVEQDGNTGRRWRVKNPEST